jgi:hypothetical protein
MTNAGDDGAAAPTRTGRNILFTTDQPRDDGLGCNGGMVAQTPVVAPA